MISYKFEEYLNNQKLLFVNIHPFEKTWHSYWKQYHTATICILNESMNGLLLNSVFMPFMQLLRHSYELLLKEKCQTTNQKFLKTHNVVCLEGIVGISNYMPLTHSDTQGDTFRYHINRNGEPHFTDLSISLLDDCKNYFSYIDKNCELIEKSNKYFQGRHYESRYVVYPSECNDLGLISTQYDYALYTLLKNVKKEAFSINDVCMPLLFLIRHSTELKLKQSISDLGNVVSNPTIVYSEHSLAKLWKELSKLYMGAIKKITDSNFKKESEMLFEKVNSFVEKLNMKDTNSLIFRYPELLYGNVSNFKPTKKIVIDNLRMMQETDSFLCFAQDVLAEEGVLQLGDDVLYEIFN